MSGLNRWVLDGHVLEDTINNHFYTDKDKAFINIANVLYNELKETQRLIKVYGGDCE